MPEFITRKELQAAAGVSQPAISKAARSFLVPALAPDGRRFLRDHPAIVSYLQRDRRKPGQRAPATPTSSPPKPPPAVTRAPQVIPLEEDPFLQAANVVKLRAIGATADGAPVPVLAGPGPQPQDGAAPAASVVTGGYDAAKGAKPALTRSQKTAADQFLFGLHEQTNGAIPSDVKDIGELTLRYVAENFGSFPCFRDVTKAMSDQANMRVKNAAASSSRSEVVERSTVRAVFGPLVDLAFRRLVSEAPAALTEQIVARVLAGGEDLSIDVEELLRRELGGILGDCRDEMARELRGLAGD